MAQGEGVIRMGRHAAGTGTAAKPAAAAGGESGPRENTTEARIVEVLRELQQVTADVQGGALVSPDGLTIAHTLRAEEAPSAAAMAAAALTLGTRVATNLETGELSEMSIKGANRRILLFDVQGKGVLLVEMAADGNFGLVVLESGRIVQKLAGLV